MFNTILEISSFQLNGHKSSFYKAFWLLSVISIILLMVACVPTTQNDTRSSNNSNGESALVEIETTNRELSVEFNSTLDYQYAQPWLDQLAEQKTTSVEFGDALATQYAEPWLDQIRQNKCNSSLDMMYACQNGYQQP